LELMERYTERCMGMRSQILWRAYFLMEFGPHL